MGTTSFIMKLLVSLITIAAGGICTLMFLKRKPALANALIPAAIMPSRKKARSLRRKTTKSPARHPKTQATHAKPRAVHHKRNGMKAHSAN